MPLGDDLLVALAQPLFADLFTVRGLGYLPHTQLEITSASAVALQMKGIGFKTDRPDG
jgi:hypothetical protein